MKDHIRRLAKWFTSDSWPVLECPTCLAGTLSAEKDAIRPEVNRATSWCAEWGQPEDIKGIFFGHLTCNNGSCGAQVAVAGDYVVEREEWPKEGWANWYRLRTIYPAVRVVEVAETVPDSVRETLARAAAIVWLDPSAGVSLLRAGIERLMDEQGIAATDSSGRFRTLHARLEEFDKTDHSVGELLLAAKWVGNEGTHPAGLDAQGFLDVAEIVELALALLYQKDTTALRQRAQRIVAAKRLVR
jgi:hypothetical protein